MNRIIVFSIFWVEKTQFQKYHPAPSSLRSMLRLLFPRAFGRIHKSNSGFSVRLIWKALHYATASFTDPGRGLLQMETWPTRCAIANWQSQVPGRVSGHGYMSRMLRERLWQRSNVLQVFTTSLIAIRWSCPFGFQPLQLS
jgi:hypothetical protein